MDSLRQRFPQLSVYYRNVTIPNHPFARSAAFAAECAARDHRFREAHRLLFTEAESIGIRSWGRFGTVIGIPDTIAFTRCIRDSLPARIVQQDEADARRLNVQVKKAAGK
jgi:protein-disulfide isomerase